MRYIILSVILLAGCTMQNTSPGAPHFTLPSRAVIEAKAYTGDQGTLLYKADITYSPAGYSNVLAITSGTIDDTALPYHERFFDRDMLPSGGSAVWAFTGAQTRYAVSGTSRIEYTYSDGMLLSRSFIAGRRTNSIRYTYEGSRITGAERTADGTVERITFRYAAVNGAYYREMTRIFIPLPTPWHDTPDALETMIISGPSPRTVSFRYSGSKAEAITTDAAGKEETASYFTFDSSGAVLERKVYAKDAEYLYAYTVRSGRTERIETYRNGVMLHDTRITYTPTGPIERMLSPEGRLRIERRISTTP